MIRISEAAKAYSNCRPKESPGEERTLQPDNCRYCGGRWVVQVPGTINGKPVYNAVCPVCGMTTKDFTFMGDLLAYLGHE